MHVCFRNQNLQPKYTMTNFIFVSIFYFCSKSHLLILIRLQRIWLSIQWKVLICSPFKYKSTDGAWKNSLHTFWLFKVPSSPIQHPIWNTNSAYSSEDCFSFDLYKFIARQIPYHACKILLDTIFIISLISYDIVSNLFSMIIVENVSSIFGFTRSMNS